MIIVALVGAFVISMVATSYSPPPPPSLNLQQLVAVHPALGSNQQVYSYLNSHNWAWFEMTSDAFVNGTRSPLHWGVMEFYVRNDASNPWFYTVLGNWKMPTEYVIKVIQSPNEVTLGEIQQSLGSSAT